MIFDNKSEIKAAGFLGYEEIQSLINNNYTNVPDRKGIYFVLRYDEPVEFLPNSVGGHFKGKNPTVPVHILKERWDDNALVVYIGQSGGGPSSTTLNKRMKQFMKFGQGQPIGHWGGRLIWQIKKNKQLKICWKSLPDNDPGEI